MSFHIWWQCKKIHFSVEFFCCASYLKIKHFELPPTYKIQHIMFSRDYLENTFVRNEEDPKCVLDEMLHSCTPAGNNDNILQSFQLQRGTIRVLIATITFGMGADCKAVHNIIHIGPPKGIKAYMQETGRDGRYRLPSMAYMLYKGILLNHVDANMNVYVKSDTCRRDFVATF